MKLSLQRPLVFFDCETTGTNAKEDFIVSLAMIKIVPIFRNEETKQALIKPPIPIPNSASEVHGIKDEDVKDAPTFSQLAKGILAFIEGCDIAGYNSNSFDIPLLYNEFKRAGITWDWKQSRFIDVGNIYKIKEPRTLSAAFKFYVGEDLADAHDALNDVGATIAVFTSQLERYELDKMTIDELALMSNFDREICDLSGTFKKDSEGDYVFNMGKHKDKKAKNEIAYLQWMTKADFDEDVKAICKELITISFKQHNYQKSKQHESR